MLVNRCGIQDAMVVRVLQDVVPLVRKEESRKAKRCINRDSGQVFGSTRKDGRQITSKDASTDSQTRSGEVQRRFSQDAVLNASNGEYGVLGSETVGTLVDEVLIACSFVRVGSRRKFASTSLSAMQHHVTMHTDSEAEGDSAFRIKKHIHACVSSNVSFVEH